MQDGLTHEDRETRSSRMLQPGVGISCDGLVAVARCSTGCSSSALTAPEPAAPEALDAATPAVCSKTGGASASPDSECLHSRVSVYERSTSERSTGMPSNGSSSASSCSSSCNASGFRTGDASCTTPPTSPPPSGAVAMFTIGEDAPSWGRDDPKERAERQPSREKAFSSAACPATKIVAGSAAVPAQSDSSAALDGTVAAVETALPHLDVLPLTSSSRRFASAAATGGVLSSLGSRAVTSTHTNGSLLLPRQHSLQDVCFSRAVSCGEPSIASVEEGAECAAAHSVSVSTGSASCSHGRRMKHRNKQRCLSDSSNGSAEETGTESTVACAARRQFESMLPLRLAIGSTRQPIGSCDCSAARSATTASANVDADAAAAAAAAESKQWHRPPLQSHKSCSAISSDDIGSHHKTSVVDDCQPPPPRQQPQPTVGGGGKAIGRISSAAELAGTTKKSWQRSAPTFGRSKSLVCTSGPVGGGQPLPASAAPPHALFLADASPRSKSHEAWRAQSGNGEKRNTFRKIARNVRNMMALLRIQKPHRSTAGTSSAISSSPPPGCAQVTLEMAENWASSFNLLLANKEGVELFRSFLHSEYSEENIEFWMACEEYRSTKAAGAAKLQAKAQAIFARFVAPHAPKEVNLDSKTRLETENNLEHPDCNAFESAKQRIQCLMEKDSYPRFLRSPLYMELVEQLRAAAVAAGGGAL